MRGMGGSSGSQKGIVTVVTVIENALKPGLSGDFL